MKTVILATLLALTAVSGVAQAGNGAGINPRTRAAKLTNSTARPQVLRLGAAFLARLQQKAPPDHSGGLVRSMLLTRCSLRNTKRKI